MHVLFDQLSRNTVARKMAVVAGSLGAFVGVTVGMSAIVDEFEPQAAKISQAADCSTVVTGSEQLVPLGNNDGNVARKLGITVCQVGVQSYMIPPKTIQ